MSESRAWRWVVVLAAVGCLHVAYEMTVTYYRQVRHASVHEVWDRVQDADERVTAALAEFRSGQAELRAFRAELDPDKGLWARHRERVEETQAAVARIEALLRTCPPDGS